MNSFPVAQISTDRLDLREYGPEDAALVAEVMAASEPEALPPGTPADPAELGTWLADGVRQLRQNNQGLHLMMLDRARGKIVGSIGLFHADWEVRSTEIGYGVASGERGKGYATEALMAVSSWALTVGGLQRAYLTANIDNVASVRVAEKAGFFREGTLRRAGAEADGLHDQALFSLLDDEVKALQPAESPYPGPATPTRLPSGSVKWPTTSPVGAR